MMRSKLRNHYKQCNIETLKDKLMMSGSLKLNRTFLKTNKIVDVITSFRKKEPTNKHISRIIKTESNQHMDDDTNHEC